MATADKLSPAVIAKLIELKFVKFVSHWFAEPHGEGLQSVHGNGIGRRGSSGVGWLWEIGVNSFIVRFAVAAMTRPGKCW